MAAIALGMAVVASFALQQPFAGVLLGLASALLALGVVLSTISALERRARRRRSMRNLAVVTLGELSIARQQPSRPAAGEPNRAGQDAPPPVRIAR